MHLYYSVKNRFGRTLTNRSEFIEKTSNMLKEALPSNIEHIVIPESSNSFIEEVVSLTGLKYSIIQKNNIEFIVSHIDELNLQKKEKLSHLSKIEKMGKNFKINELKANQRRKYLHLLFEKRDFLDIEKSIIVDDSFFSGTTYEALKFSTGISNFFFIFSK